MNLLVIGDTGFIGSQISHFATKKGHLVRGLSRRNWGSIKSFSKSSGQFDLIINAAGVSNNNKNGREYINGNIKIAEDICQFFNRSNVPLINISAACIYNNTDEEFINEQSQIINPNAYSLSKLCVEIIFNECNSPTLNIRLPAVLGPKAPTSWPVRLLNNKKNGIKNIIQNPKNLYNHVIHIENLCDFIFSENLHKVIQEKDKSTINLYSDEAITFCEAASILLDGETFEFKDAEKNSSILSSQVAKSEFNFKPWTVLSALKKFKKQYYEE
jgi:nucleoside-diphosphate-sugar epimerase